MASVNKCILVGNITRDAEIKQVGQNTLAKFGVATSERYTDRNGQVKEDTEFHNIELWGNAGVQKYLVKGQLVYVEGSLKTNTYTDRNGVDRSDKYIKSFSVSLLGGQKKDGAQECKSSDSRADEKDDLPF